MCAPGSGCFTLPGIEIIFCEGIVGSPLAAPLHTLRLYRGAGAAANLSQVVNFYNERLQIELTLQPMQDLLHFLQSW
jgi:hypothetical protein